MKKLIPVVLSAFVFAGCADVDEDFEAEAELDGDVIEETGETLEEAGEETVDTLEEAGENAGEALDEATDEVDEAVDIEVD